MRDHIRSTLVERIVSGVYAPGTHLKELALAAEFNVSQAPVREALRELEAGGLVVSERYRGTRVLGIDPDELKQAYELREMIESAAIRQCGPLDDEALTKLDALIDSMVECFNASESSRLCAFGMTFHRTLVMLSGKSMYLRAWDGLTWDVRVHVVALVVGHDFSKSIMDKRAVLDALRRGDHEAAAQTISHILQGMIAMIGEASFPEAKLKSVVASKDDDARLDHFR